MNIEGVSYNLDVMSHFDSEDGDLSINFTFDSLSLAVDYKDHVVFKALDDEGPSNVKIEFVLGNSDIEVSC